MTFWQRKQTRAGEAAERELSAGENPSEPGRQASKHPSQQSITPEESSELMGTFEWAHTFPPLQQFS